MKKIFLSLFLLIVTPLFATVDLSKLEQDYMLEAKQILIPEYMDALNPSMVNYGDNILFCFRIRDPLTTKADKIGIMILDKDFNRITEPKELRINKSYYYKDVWTQDARLVKVKDDIYIVFNDFAVVSNGDHNRRQFYSKVECDDDGFYVDAPDAILVFEWEDPLKQEKNWVPFDYQGNLLLAHTISPHLIFKPIIGTTHAAIFSENNDNFVWNWGEVRGGTPAIKIDDQYLAFFHSSKYMPTVQSNNKYIHHYYMGAYLFEAKPPFTITKMSPEPLVEKHFYQGKKYKTWQPLLVVFPGGFIFDDQYIFVTYGRQDHEVWVVKIDKKGLLNSLVPIKKVEGQF